MVLPRFKTFCKHPLINLIEILPLAIQWYTVQNVSHKEGWWLIKCSIFLGVWLLLDFKMTYIKITHLYVFAAYSSIITTAEWLFNLGWKHDWKSDLQSDSLVWNSFTWANGGSQCQPAKGDHPSSSSRFVCLLQRASQSQHQSWGSRGATLLSPRSAESSEREQHWQLKSFLLSFEDVKETWKRYIQNLLSFCTLLEPSLFSSSYFCITTHTDFVPVPEEIWINPAVVKKGFFLAWFLAYISWVTSNIFVRIPPVKTHCWLTVDNGWLNFLCCCPAKKKLNK